MCACTFSYCSGPDDLCMYAHIHILVLKTNVYTYIDIYTTYIYYVHDQTVTMWDVPCALAL